MNHFKNLVIFSLLMLIVHLAVAQHYSFRKMEGASPHLGDMRNSKTVMEAPARETLSEWQSMPFDWWFYGQKVEGFYVSVNGYITFDKAARGSFSQPLALPNPKGPTNAIFVCWADWQLEASERNPGRVYSWVQGQAPNRILGISWLTLAPASLQEETTSRTNLFLFLHENGNFEILSRSNLEADIPALAGTHNEDATRSSLLTNTPLPHRSFRPNEDVSWLFEYSDQNLQARVTQTNLEASHKLGDEKEILARLWNTGSESIRSLTITWQQQGKPLQRKQFRRLGINANDFYDLNLGSWKAEEAGTFSRLKFRVEEINGRKVENPAFEQQVFVNLGKSAPTKVLAEKFTGTWCGWCPDGMVELKKLVAANHRIIPLAIHVRDTMEIASGKELSDFYRPAYPEAMINRIFWPGEPKVPVSRTNNAWGEFIDKALDVPSPVEISMDHWFDPATGKLRVNVNASFVDYALPGDLRFHLLVAEDKVSSQDPAFNQGNFFSGNASYPDHPYFDAPRQIPGYVHHFLLRQAPSGPWGTPGIIGPEPAPGQVFTFSYELEIPPHYVRENVSLLGFVSYFDENPGKRQLLNVQDKPLLPAAAFTGPMQSQAEKHFLEGIRQTRANENSGLRFIEVVRELDAMDIEAPDYLMAGLLNYRANRRNEASSFLEQYLQLFPGQAPAELFAALATHYAYEGKVQKAEAFYQEALKRMDSRNQTFSLSNTRLIDEMDMALLIAYVKDQQDEKACNKGFEIVNYLKTEQPAQFAWVNLFNFFSQALMKLDMHDDAIDFLEGQIAQHGPGTSLAQRATMNKIQVSYDLLLKKENREVANQYLKSSRAKMTDQYVLRSFDTFTSHAMLIGEKASGLLVDNWLLGSLDLDALKGQVVILDFWATWCGPCRASFPKMNALYRKHKDNGLEMIGITRPYGYVSIPGGEVIRNLSYEQEVNLTREFVETMNLEFPQLMERSGQNGRNFGVGFLPTVVVIDRQGIIRYIDSSIDTALETMINHLISQPVSQN